MIADPHIPNHDDSLSSKVLWSLVSKVADKSRRMAAVASSQTVMFPQIEYKTNDCAAANEKLSSLLHRMLLQLFGSLEDIFPFTQIIHHLGVFESKVTPALAPLTMGIIVHRLRGISIFNTTCMRQKIPIILQGMYVFSRP